LINQFNKLSLDETNSNFLIANQPFLKSYLLPKSKERFAFQIELVVRNYFYCNLDFLFFEKHPEDFIKKVRDALRNKIQTLVFFGNPNSHNEANRYQFYCIYPRHFRLKRLWLISI